MLISTSSLQQLLLVSWVVGPQIRISARSSASVKAVSLTWTPSARNGKAKTSATFSWKCSMMDDLIHRGQFGFGLLAMLFDSHSACSFQSPVFFGLHVEYLFWYVSEDSFPNDAPTCVKLKLLKVFDFILAVIVDNVI